MTEKLADLRAQALEEVERRRLLSLGAARQDRIVRQHERGQLTAHERIDLLLDSKTFRPMGRFTCGEDLTEMERTIGGDGVVCGFGSIDGRPVGVSTQDPTIKGGSGGAAGFLLRKSYARVVEKCRLPEFNLKVGGGMRITEAMTSKFAGIDGQGMGARDVFGPRHLNFEGWLGDNFGPETTADFVVMTAQAHASITSSALLEMATGQRNTNDELGGSEIHARVTGQVDAVAEDEAGAIALLRKAFSYYPSYPGGEPPRVLTGDAPDRATPELRDVLPENERRAFDIRKVILPLFDQGSFLEFSPDYAKNLITGLARLDGWPVAVVANQSMSMAGTVDTQAIIKARRILDLASMYSIPFVSILDTPGILTTLAQEHNRLIAAAYELGISRLRPEVPKVALIVRKANGFAYMMMSAGDPEGLTFAWPSARIAFTGPEPAAKIVYGRDIEAASDPVMLLTQRADEMRELSKPQLAAELALIDGIIDPADTRRVVVQAMDLLRTPSGNRRRSLKYVG